MVFGHSSGVSVSTCAVKCAFLGIISHLSVEGLPGSSANNSAYDSHRVSGQSSYDEIPMQTRASEVFGKTNAPRAAQATSAITPRIKREFVAADTCLSKILHARSAVSMLVK